ncbi:MAG: hypothetical protein WCS52_00410 [bacterium]
MNTFTIKARVLAGLMALCFATTGWAVAPPWDEGFEAYPVNTALSDVTGWGGTDPTVKVQTNVVSSPALGTNAVVMLPDKIASNLVVSASLTNVWFDFYLTNSMAMAVGSVGGEVIDSNMTVQLYIETNGYPVAWHPVSNAWVVCSNDYWGTPTTAFNTNPWMRFTVCANYSNKTAAVFLNQHLLLQQVRFIDTNRTQSGRFQLDGGSAVTSYFDEVSVRYVPTNMTADLDNDGMADADEINLYSSVGLRHRPLITVTQPANGAITPAGSFDILPGSTTNFSVQALPAYGVSQLMTNGQSVGAFTGQNTRNASFSWATMIPAGLSDGSFSATITYTARRYVPADYPTIQSALTAAIAGDSVIVSNGPYSESVTLGNGVNLVATNATITGLTVAPGTTGMVVATTGLMVGVTTVNGLLIVSNGAVNLGTLVIGAGGTVQVVNATSFIVNGTTMSGTFTLDASWGAVIRAQTPPFTDDFERYANNAGMASMGFYGWGTPDGGIIVQRSVVTQGVQAVVMPSNTMLSNSLAASASSNVWAEWNYRESGRIDESTVFVTGEDTNLTVLLFINTSNYVTVFNPEQGCCSVLSNDVWNQPVVPLSTSDWPRIAVNMNYLTRRAAVMLNGRLLVQELRFINTNQVNCERLEWEAGTAGPSYLDDLKVWTNAVPVHSLDGDGDGTPDAEEIDHSGNVFFWPNGVIFKIR